MEATLEEACTTHENVDEVVAVKISLLVSS